jgi:hypothetical protein
MDEDGIPEVLKTERMGHKMPGMHGVYGHVSPAMRATLKAALQERWENSLRERANSPHAHMYRRLKHFSRNSDRTPRRPRSWRSTNRRGRPFLVRFQSSPFASVKRMVSAISEWSSDRTSTVRISFGGRTVRMPDLSFTQAGFDIFLELPAVLEPGGCQHSNLKNRRIA